MNILILLSLTHLTMPYNGKIFSYGTAFTSIKEEPENLFWNPAGMGKNAYITSVYDYSSMIFGSFGKIWELKSFNIGTGVQLMRSEGITKTDMTGDSTGIFHYQSVIPVIAGNLKINKYIIGAKILLPYTTVDEFQSYGAGIEIGSIYNLNELFTFSCYIRNFGKQIKAFLTEKESFPVEIRLGGLTNYNNIKFSLEYSSQFGPCSFISYDLNKKIGFTAGYNRKFSNFNSIQTSKLAGSSFAVNIKHRSIYVSLGAIFSGPEGICKTLSISIIP